MAGKKRSIIFRPAAGCPFSQKDIDIIGPELLKLSEELKVDIRQLTTKQVKKLLERDRSNPLWGFIDTNPKRAMAEWIKSQISHMIRCVRYEHVDIPKLTPQALFVDVKDTSFAGTGGTGRAKVVAIDAFDKESIAARIADGKVLRVRQAVKNLSDWIAGAKVPKPYRSLAESLETALYAFDDTKTPIAAE